MTTTATAPAPGFEAPGVEDFQLPPVFGPVTKPVLELVLAAVIIAAFFLVAVRKPALVPGKTQFLGEAFHGLVRNTIARDMIGGRDFVKYVPFLTALFAFILVNNLFGIIPFIQFPTFSHPSVPYALAALVYVVFTYAGIRKHGFGGYVRLSTWPPDVPWWVRIILTPIEFLSNLVLRPVTLSLRLFGNMFAGHLLLLLFVLGGEYMLLEAGDWQLKVLSPFAFLMAIVFTFFEAFVQVIQAYIFVMLTASYIGTVLADDH
ncbi:F0F1 ATP synthase subunit A [Pseudonocardia halophobica]|uniref:ATP synthase subunit a n=1 Tax=Pseudonocardia halophobica TaxID=29401 RepID=A0A9W6NVF0_9PSEU|nr:F0F1 ATP synthase subunit A [Pseudonocardia halophobica]GLL10799.1 ATP synthase subunit a [Pseudonocardia halophobica]